VVIKGRVMSAVIVKQSNPDTELLEKLGVFA
jgi:hypothetical protein